MHSHLKMFYQFQNVNNNLKKRNQEMFRTIAYSLTWRCYANFQTQIISKKRNQLIFRVSVYSLTWSCCTNFQTPKNLKERMHLIFRVNVTSSKVLGTNFTTPLSPANAIWSFSFVRKKGVHCNCPIEQHSFRFFLFFLRQLMPGL